MTPEKTVKATSGDNPATSLKGSDAWRRQATPIIFSKDCFESICCNHCFEASLAILIIFRKNVVSASERSIYSFHRKTPPQSCAVMGWEGIDTPHIFCCMLETPWIYIIMTFCQIPISVYMKCALWPLRINLSLLSPKQTTQASLTKHQDQ